MPVSDSKAVLTAPQETTVVIAVKSAELAMPKRCSLPSMLPPVDPATCRCDAGEVLGRRAVRLGDVDDGDADDEQDAIAAKIAQPWRRLPTMRPYVYVSDGRDAAG